MTAAPDVPGDLEALRAEVRRWLSQHVPGDWRTRMRGAAHEEYVEFQRWWLGALREEGYAAPHWPREWGGGGFSLLEQVVLYEEMARADAPRLGLYFVSLHHTAATLFDAGTDEQRARHLPAILDGEVWCQGFSEPEAGSDLASLRTRAERRGDRYVVNGQKVWSSLASHADFCLLLARTDPAAPKRRGISYLLLDMSSPGVEVRPIRQSSGAAEFCEIFLTDVEVPTDCLVGSENDGWRIAQSTLTSERGPAVLELAERMRNAFSRLLALARDIEAQRGLDGAVLQELARTHEEVEILHLLSSRMLEHLVTRGGPGPEASIIKIFFSELLQRLTELGTRIEGLPAHEDAQPVMGDPWSTGNWMLDYVNSWMWTIAGGTNEIQRTLVGERILGLPREPEVTSGGGGAGAGGAGAGGAGAGR